MVARRWVLPYWHRFMAYKRIAPVPYLVAFTPILIGVELLQWGVSSVANDGESDIWSYGVTVSTLDSESSDRGSNPRRTFLMMLTVASRNVVAAV